MQKLITLVLFFSGFLYAQSAVIPESGDSVQPSSEEDPRCKENGIIPVPNDCTSYIVCRNGRARVRKCPDDFRFDSVKYCTPDEDADCGTPTFIHNFKVDLCPINYGIIPHPYDCQKYIVCVEGRGIVRECSEGYVYVDDVGCVERGTCPSTYMIRIFAKEETCNLPPETGPCFGSFKAFYYDKNNDSCKEFVYGGCGGNANKFLDEDSCRQACRLDEEILVDEFYCKEEGRFANPNSCGSFLECSVNEDGLVFTEVQCPENEHYSTETKQCEDKCIAKCDQSLACECLWPHCQITCEEQNGVFPVPSDCTLFLVCTDSIPVVLKCTEGQAFDPEMKQCLNMEDTNCEPVVNDVLNIMET